MVGPVGLEPTTDRL